MVVLHPPQVLGQLLAARLAWRLAGFVAAPVIGLALQRLQLRLQIRLVLRGGFLEHLPLRGAHAFGAGGELPRLQPRQLGHLLELGVLELDLGFATLHQLMLLLDLVRLGADLRQQTRGQLRDRLGRQALEVFGA